MDPDDPVMATTIFFIFNIHLGKIDPFGPRSDRLSGFRETIERRVCFNKV
jgi:hypothetical protein